MQPRGPTARTGILLALLCLSVIIATPASAHRYQPFSGPLELPASELPTTFAATPSSTGAYFDHAVIILMENHAICDILKGLDNCTSGAGPYETGLAKQYGLGTRYVKCGAPSLPNYLCLSGASTFGCTSDDLPNSTTCTKLAWKAPNIVDRILGAGLTWKAYMENMTKNCSTSNSGTYVTKHDPFVYYGDIVLNATRCKRVIPAGTDDAALLNDLNSTATSSNYMWLTPNMCNDMHDCSVAIGDNYLKRLVPRILNSTLFTSTRAALFITFDEDSGGSGHPYVYTTWSGPVAKQGFVSASGYNHFSLLKTLELNWNLSPLTANDSKASNMTTFFGPGGPNFSLSADPSSVTFVVGQGATSVIALHPTGGFNGTVSLTGSSSPAGVTASFSPSRITGNETSLCTLNSTAAGSYTVTVTGTSGPLVRNTTIAVTVTTAPPPLSASFTFSPATPSPAQTVNFTGSASGGAPPYTYAWQFGDGKTGTGAKVSHVYSSPGTYSVNLTVVDSVNHTSKATHALKVSVPALTASFTFAPLTPTVGQPVTFTAAVSGGVPPYQEAWQFGDGSIGNGGTLEHTYARPGTFAVNLTVTDSVSATARVAKSVSVTSPAPPQVTTEAVSGVGPTNATLHAQLTSLGTAVSVTVGFRWSTNSTFATAANETVGTLNSPGPATADVTGLKAATGYYVQAWAKGDGFAVGATLSFTTLSQSPRGSPTASIAKQGTEGRNGWYTSNVTLVLNATDPSGPEVWVLYQLDASAWFNYTSPLLLTSGVHTLVFQAMDGYGDPPGALQFANVSVDTSPPVINSLLPSGVVTTSTVSIRWGAVDSPSGVAEYDLAVDGGAPVPMGLNESASLNFADGSHTIRLRATDVAGNSANAVTTVQVSTNPFSFPGPYAGLPLVLTIGAMILVGGLWIARARRRRQSRRR